MNSVLHLKLCTAKLKFNYSVNEKIMQLTSYPLVSIVIPTRNRPQMVRDAVKSVLNQTYENLQIIIQDNNSNEDISKIIKAEFTDPRLEMNRSNETLSMLLNWREGLKLVRGKYLVRLDDDNVFVSDFIENAIGLFKTSDVDVIQFESLDLTQDGRVSTQRSAASPLYCPSPQAIFLNEFIARKDSNYAVYSVSALRSIFPEGLEKIYESTLPDRYLHYTLANAYSSGKIKYRYSDFIGGLSRYDHKKKFISEEDSRKVLFFSELNNPTKEYVFEDCQDRFYFHRFLTVARFVRSNPQSLLSEWFERNYFDLKLARSYAVLFRIAEVTVYKRLADISAINTMILFAIKNLALKPLAYVGGIRSAKLIISLLVILMKVNIKKFNIRKTTGCEKTQTQDPQSVQSFNSTRVSSILSEAINLNQSDVDLFVHRYG